MIIYLNYKDIAKDVSSCHIYAYGIVLIKNRGKCVKYSENILIRSIIYSIIRLIMRDQIEKIVEILTKTESEIQKVIIEAAQASDYRSVDMARNAAVNIKNLRAQISDTTRKVESKSVKAEKRVKRKVVSRKAARTGYPKFQIKKDTLIRIGWSKKQRREYTHKTTRFVFEITIKAMAKLAKSGAGPFTSEQLIDQINSVESETIPSYQVYAVIGILRQANCIKQIGRNGYDIPPEILEKAEQKWSELSNRKE